MTFTNNNPYRHIFFISHAYLYLNLVKNDDLFTLIIYDIKSLMVCILLVQRLFTIEKMLI